MRKDLIIRFKEKYKNSSENQPLKSEVYTKNKNKNKLQPIIK